MAPRTESKPKQPQWWQKKIEELEKIVADQKVKLDLIPENLSAAIAERDEARQVAIDLKAEVDSLEQQLADRPDEAAVAPEAVEADLLPFEQLAGTKIIQVLSTHDAQGEPTGWDAGKHILLEYRERAVFAQDNGWSQSVIHGRARSACDRAFDYSVQRAINRLGYYHDGRSEGCRALESFSRDAYLEMIFRIVDPAG